MCIRDRQKDDKEEERRQEREETEKRRKQEADDIKALIQVEKQMQEHSPAQLGLLFGDLVNYEVSLINKLPDYLT